MWCDAIMLTWSGEIFEKSLFIDFMQSEVDWWKRTKLNYAHDSFWIRFLTNDSHQIKQKSTAKVWPGFVLSKKFEAKL